MSFSSYPHCCEHHDTPKCGCGGVATPTKPPYTADPRPTGVGPTAFCDIQNAIKYVKRHAESCGCQDVCEKEDADIEIEEGLQLCAIECEACDEWGGWLYSPQAYFIELLSMNTGSITKSVLLDESFSYEATGNVVSRMRDSLAALLKKLKCSDCATPVMIPPMFVGSLTVGPKKCKKKRCLGACSCS